MYFGNFDIEKLFTPESIMIKPGEFSKEVPDMGKVERFKKFLNENGFKKNETADIKENEFRICEGIHILCGTEEMARKIHSFLTKEENKISVKFLQIVW